MLIGDLNALPVVRAAERAPSFQKVYGKRIIVVGGGAQVGQVVVGAVAEADRHNIRGEKISVDTIPLVGEEELAAATRAVARLPRAVALVLAGALMGGEVARAVHEIRGKGIIVLSLNMPGSVPDAADLVVSDPVQCGVMAVMAVSDRPASTSLASGVKDISPLGRHVEACPATSRSGTWGNWVHLRAAACEGGLQGVRP